MTTTPAIRVTDDSTRSEIAEALTHLAIRATREFPKVGTPEHPTKWDERHEIIDGLLTDYQAASV